MIKTFRGLLADLTNERIRLSTIKGKVGYRVINFRIMTNNPGSDQDVEHVLKIYKTKQTSTPTGTVDFGDSDLLGAGMTRGDTAHEYPMTETVIFDTEMFNQDIYVTHKDNNIGAACNYYIELEVIPLDDAGAEYTTLKDMRQPG